MKAFNYKVVIRSIIVAGTMAVTLAACTKGAQNNRLGMNNTPVNVAPNGAYTAANSNTPCNINDTNPQDMASPYDQQSPCYNPNIVANTRNNIPVINQQGAGPFANQQPQQQGFPNGQQQVAPNGQMPMAPNYGVPQTSTDIPTTGVGRIVNRQFQLSSGQGLQDATDNCAINKDNLGDVDESDIETVGDVHTYHWGRPLYPPNSPPAQVMGRQNPQFIPDRFDLFFDNNGNLRVSAQSEIGQTSTSQLITPVPFDPSNPPGPGEYALDPDTRTLNIGAFSMTGPESDLFVRHEQFLAAVLKHQNDIDQYDKLGLDGPLPSDVAQSFSNSGAGQATFVVGQGPSGSQGPKAQNANFTFRPQNLGMPHQTSPNFVTLSIPQFVAEIAILLPINPQHITGLLAKEVHWDGTTYIDATNGFDKCNGTAHGSYVNLFLK